MFKYVLKRILLIIPKILAISIIIYACMELLPGDPLSRTMDPHTYMELTEYQRELQREALGLNDPAPVRYLRWLGGVLQGDFGYSVSTGQSIAEMVAARLPATIELNIFGIAIATLLGIFFGFVAAIFKNTVLDYSLSTVSIVGTTMPQFFFAICWLFVFSLSLGWFPVGGRMNPAGGSRIPYMILPIWTIVFGMLAGMLRVVRIYMLDTMEKDYVKTARSKGLSETQVYTKHAFRNALIPVMTVVVMRIPGIIGGSVVIEQVFNYTGIGMMGLTALTAGDYPVTLFSILISALLSMLASTLCDIVAAALDPRVRVK